MAQEMLLKSQEAPVGQPYWWEEAPPQGTDDALPDSTEVLVIGAGYTGLSAAIAAHDCGARVVIVEAGVPGEGASSRNGGMVGAHPRLSWDKLASRFGEKTADGVFAEASTALSWAKAFMQAEDIACDFQQTGRIQLAWTVAHFAGQQRLAEAITAKSNVEVSMVSRENLGHEIETGCYQGGLLFSEHGGLHPAKYHAGMVAAVRRRSIPIVSHARVDRKEREGARHRVYTAKGQILAEKLILATNGYTTRPFGWHVSRVFPLPSYLIATEELPANLIGHLVPGRRMMVETRARHSYFRVSPDGKRILFGGRSSMRDVPLGLAAARLHQTMVGIWPELEDTKVTHAWTGYTGFSFSQIPHVGQRDGVCFAMGYSGSGTVLAPYLGAKAGYLAVGDARAETAYQNTAFSPSLLHPFEKPHFLKLADMWYRHWVDNREDWQARS